MQPVINTTVLDSRVSIQCKVFDDWMTISGGYDCTQGYAYTQQTIQCNAGTWQYQDGYFQGEESWLTLTQENVHQCSDIISNKTCTQPGQMGCICDGVPCGFDEYCNEGTCETGGDTCSLNIGECPTPCVAICPTGGSCTKCNELICTNPSSTWNPPIASGCSDDSACGTNEFCELPGTCDVDSECGTDEFCDLS